MTKKNNWATVILTAVCGLFAFVPTARAEGWRVIAEDPQFPTDDVVVAFCSVTDSQYKLPADPSTSDCTPAIQRALDDASAAGGGTVFIPAGRYRLDGMLTIASNVFGIVVENPNVSGLRRTTEIKATQKKLRAAHIRTTNTVAESLRRLRKGLQLFGKGSFMPRVTFLCRRKCLIFKHLRVGDTELESVTSSMSTRRSKPTELIALNRVEISLNDYLHRKFKSLVSLDSAS